jgi:hypothetical protein
MATLIAVFSGSDCNGKRICIGRCDAKCYTALHPDCDCICGGKNHGAGLETATQNTRNLAEQWLDEYAQRKGLNEYTHTIGRRVQVHQPALFDIANFSNSILAS